jgi:hypothetical protein
MRERMTRSRDPANRPPRADDHFVPNQQPATTGPGVALRKRAPRRPQRKADAEQSCSQRRTATIGVIQMSPKRKPARDRCRDRSGRPPGRPPSVEWSHGSVAGRCCCLTPVGATTSSWLLSRERDRQPDGVCRARLPERCLCRRVRWRKVQLLLLLQTDREPRHSAALLLRPCRCLQARSTSANARCHSSRRSGIPTSTTSRTRARRLIEQ